MYKLKVNATVMPLLRDKHYLTMRELVYYVTFFEGVGAMGGKRLWYSFRRYYLKI